MSIHVKELAFKEAIYTHVANDGTTTIVAIDRLWKWVQANKKFLEVQLVPVDEEFAASFIKNNVVSRERLMELIQRVGRKRYKLDPIIFGKDGKFTYNRPDVFMMDGHHRYVIHAVLNIPLIKAYVLEEIDWEPFKVVGHPDITQEKLKGVPILKRLY
jgi:hypothetical protein